MKAAKRVLIATGGTGGHVIPSESLAHELQEDGVEILMSGAALSRNRYFDKDSFEFIDIHSGSGLRSIPQVLRGIFDSLKIINQFKPDLIVGFGSFTSFPLLVAGKIKGVPLVLWAADSIPGKVIRWFSRYAKFTGVHFPQAAKYLKGTVKQCPMPLRRNFHLNKVSHEEALKFYDLEGKNPVILVMGGSHGARFLNEVAPLAISELPTQVDVIHITGNPEDALKVDSLYVEKGILARVKPYEKEMNKAWRAASIACTRAGAVSCAEQIEFEVPGVVVPYPGSMDRHQDLNAEFLATLGLVEIQTEKDCTPEDLSQTLFTLLHSVSERKEKLKSTKEKISLPSFKTLIMEQLA